MRSSAKASSYQSLPLAESFYTTNTAVANSISSRCAPPLSFSVAYQVPQIPKIALDNSLIYGILHFIGNYVFGVRELAPAFLFRAPLVLISPKQSHLESRTYEM